MKDLRVLLYIATCAGTLSLISSCTWGEYRPSFKEAFTYTEQQERKTGKPMFYIRRSQFNELVRSGKLRPGLTEKQVVEILGDPYFRGKIEPPPDASEAERAELDRLTELTYSLDPISWVSIYIDENGCYVGYSTGQDGG